MNDLVIAFPALKSNLAFVKDILIKQFKIDPSLGTEGLDFNCDDHNSNILKLE